MSPLELDYLMENRYIENLVTSAHALQSVCELVGSIRNMAISEKLKTLIVDAMDAFKLVGCHLYFF